MQTTIPQIKIGSQVRVKRGGIWQNKRGIVTEQVSEHLFGIALDNIKGVVDFSTTDLTVLE